MTTIAQRYTIFGYGIHLHIVNMMNVFTVSITNGASVIISLAYDTLKLFVESCWIWFKRNTTHPSGGFFPRLVYSPPFIMALLRAKLSIPALFIAEYFRALNTGIFFFAARPKVRFISMQSSSLRATRSGAVFIIYCKRWVKVICFSAIRACQFYFSSLPSSCLLFSFITRSARVRTIKTVEYSVRRNKIIFPTEFTNFFYFHINLIKGVSRSVSQYCCSRNTDRTGDIKTKNLTNCVA